MTEQNFLAAPKIIPGEALSSWIHRLCQSQGISIMQLYKLLKSKIPRDVDSEKFPTAVFKLLTMTRHDIQDFGLVTSVNRSIVLTDALRKQLRTGSDQASATAFCAQCLRTDRVPYYRIEWRFYFWHTCPKHLVELFRCCPSCRKPLELKRPILVSHEAVPNLAFCYFCHFYLGHSMNPSHYESNTEAEKIKVQVSMMAAVAYGYYKVQPLVERFSLHSMFQLYHSGLLEPAAKHGNLISPTFGKEIWSRCLHLLDERETAKQRQK